MTDVNGNPGMGTLSGDFTVINGDISVPGNDVTAGSVSLCGHQHENSGGSCVTPSSKVVKMNIGSLDGIVFETSSQQALTPNSVKRSFDSRYEDHPMQDWYEQSEFLAPSLGTVSLSIHLRQGLLDESSFNT